MSVSNHLVSMPSSLGHSILNEIWVEKEREASDKADTIEYSQTTSRFAVFSEYTQSTPM